MAISTKALWKRYHGARADARAMLADNIAARQGGRPLPHPPSRLQAKGVQIAEAAEALRARGEQPLDEERN